MPTGQASSDLRLSIHALLALLSLRTTASGTGLLTLPIQLPGEAWGGGGYHSRRRESVRRSRRFRGRLSRTPELAGHSNYLQDLARLTSMVSISAVAASTAPAIAGRMCSGVMEDHLGRSGAAEAPAAARPMVQAARGLEASGAIAEVTTEALRKWWWGARGAAAEEEEERRAPERRAARKTAEEEEESVAVEIRDIVVCLRRARSGTG